MKRLNGPPVVRFRLVCDFELSVEQSESVIKCGTDADRVKRLKELVESSCPTDASIHSADITPSAYPHGYAAFYFAYSAVLAEKRANELRLLEAPKPEPKPTITMWNTSYLRCTSASICTVEMARSSLSPMNSSI